MPSSKPSIPGWQIAGYAYGAGLRGKALETAVAVAYAESGGRPDAVGDTLIQTKAWGPSYGLWQIRSLKEERGTGGPRDGTRLPDPAFNARAMAQISAGGSNWKPWSTYNSGAYRLYLPSAKKAVKDYQAAGSSAQAWANQSAAGLGGAVGAAGGALGDVAGAVGDGLREAASNPILAAVGTLQAGVGWVSDRNNWVRVMKVIVGGGLVVAGLVVVARPITAPVVKTVSKIA